MLGCINLILNFVLSEVAFNGVSKLATFEASATTVNYYDNVLQRTSQVMVPIALPAGVDHLRPRTTITARKWSVFDRRFARVQGYLHAEQDGIFCATSIVH
jgi:hypothetical protein